MTDKLHHITVLPQGEVYEIDEKTDLLTFFREKNIYVKSSCGGHATCSDCIIKIVAGEDHLCPPPFEELKLLGNVFHLTKERLACQTKITGDITVDLTKHNKVNDENRLKSKTSNFMKKPAIKLRKEKDIVKKEARTIEKPPRREDETWKKHWEKDKDANAPKRLQGGKKPKFFDTDKIDYEKKDYDRPLSFEKQAQKRIAKKAEPKLAPELEQKLDEIDKNENQDSKGFKKFRE